VYHGEAFGGTGASRVSSLAVASRLLDPRPVPVLRELREVNALMFDFVLKRSLRDQGAGTPASAFETRGFLERGA
jgi:hypothetical protein